MLDTRTSAPDVLWNVPTEKCPRSVKFNLAKFGITQGEKRVAYLADVIAIGSTAVRITLVFCILVLDTHASAEVAGHTLLLTNYSKGFLLPSRTVAPTLSRTKKY